MIVLFIVISICLLIGYIVTEIRIYKQEKPEYDCSHKWEEIAHGDFEYSDEYLFKCTKCGKLHRTTL